jgi:hypothetical protein
MPDVSYVPGQLIAVAGERCLALVEAAPDSAAASRLWQLVGRGTAAEEVLADLLGRGFEDVDGFALLSDPAAEPRRLFCRGALGATVEGGNVYARIDGVGLATWREYPIAVDAERIVLGQPPDAAVLRLPAAAGVLLARCVIIDLTWAAARATIPYDSPASSHSATVAAGRRTEPPDRASSLDLTVLSPAPAADEPAPLPLDAAASPPDSLRGESEIDPPDPPEAFETVVPPAPAEASTLLVPLTPAEPSAPAEPLALVLPFAPVDAPALAAAPESAPPPAPSRLIDAVQWGSGRDASEFTTKRAELPAAGQTQPGAPSQTLVSTGPTVSALICPAGHANPPSEAVCRRCGAPLPNDAVLVPRPVLGALRLSTGDVVALDRGVVMGRDPRADPVSPDGPEPPHVVKLESTDGDISRTHLRVTLDGWHVLVTDLNSTNGTLVTLPGRDPEQVRPGEPVPIRPGTVVTLADGIDFRYEVHE